MRKGEWGMARRLGVGVVTAALAAVGLLGVAPVGAVGSTAAPRIVSLTFDDGRVSQGVVDGLLASHGLNGTFYIITHAVDSGGDNPESLTWAQIHQLAHDSNEIAGHTRTHPDLPKLSQGDQTQEVCGSRQDLLAQGFEAVSFAYPYGDYNPTIEQVVKSCGYASGRGAWGGVKSIPPADRYALRTLPNVTDQDHVAGLEAETTKAKPGQWLQYVFHDIGDAYPGGDQYRITTRNFTAFLDWLGRERNRGTIVIKTIGSVVH
jgi:peptidoglycan/xylan/chitin deacetylase (PgdA/CDA1 family)